MLVDFLANNYLWFLVITLVLVFALIGFLVDTKEQKKNSYQSDSKEVEQKFEDLAAAAVPNKSIQDYVTASDRKSTLEMPSPASSKVETLEDNPFVGYPTDSVSMNTTNPVSSGNSFEALPK